jgi:hypothetical protein
MILSQFASRLRRPCLVYEHILKRVGLVDRGAKWLKRAILLVPGLLQLALYFVKKNFTVSGKSKIVVHFPQSKLEIVHGTYSRFSPLPFNSAA